MKLLIEDIQRKCNIGYVEYRLEDMVTGYRNRFPVYNKWMLDNISSPHSDPIPEFRVYSQTGIVGDDRIVICHDNVNIIERNLAFSLHRLKNEIEYT